MTTFEFLEKDAHLVPRILQNTFEDLSKSTLVQVTASYLTAPNHCLSQCWHRSLSPNVVTRPQWVNIKKMWHTSASNYFNYNKITEERPTFAIQIQMNLICRVQTCLVHPNPTYLGISRFTQISMISILAYCYIEHKILNLTSTTFNV